MGKATVNSKACVHRPPSFAFQNLVTTFFVFSTEDPVPKEVPPPSPNSSGTANNARAEFYDRFQRELDEYDRDFMKKYEDLNATLIYVSFMSASTSTVAR